MHARVDTVTEGRSAESELLPWISLGRDMAPFRPLIPFGGKLGYLVRMFIREILLLGPIGLQVV